MTTRNQIVPERRATEKARRRFTLPDGRLFAIRLNPADRNSSTLPD